MAVEIEGVRYLTSAEVVESIKVSRQTLWRWRQEGHIPPGHRFRGKQVVFSPEEMDAIREYANRLEPIAGEAKQLRLFNGPKSRQD
jgi:predicted DNA-binding transcriptional regulator AlpA